MTINNNNIFGLFTLNEARGSRLTGDWLHTDTIANYGWFGGGSNGPTVATVDRIDFSNDSVSASPRGSLSSARQGLTATGNSNYGWFGGGASGAVSTVDRIDFSNDSATASVRGSLSLARWKLAATGNSNYGWFGGGVSPGPNLSTVDRIDFSNDAATALARGPLSSGRYNMGATGNSNYGWFAASGGISTVDRIDFSNDASIASVRGPLSLSRGALTATGNSNYGWFGGGDTPSGPGPIEYTVVQRIDFSNDLSTASIRGPLTSPGRSNLAATGNSNYGWFGGGLFSIPSPPPTGASTTRVTSVDRIDFSNDSVTASPRGSLTSPARSNLAATSGVLNIRRQKAGNYGWFGGGVNYALPPATAFTNIVQRIDFSNDNSTAVQRGPLVSSKYVTFSSAATGNSNYGWFGGGFVVATVDRIDFSNDSSTASSRGSLSLARWGLAATGNSNYGWFGGGVIPGPTTYSTVDRIDFANNSTTASPRGLLSLERYSLAATGNSNYGWFGGGVNPAATPSIVSTVDRIDFSNDSSTASPRGVLSQARYVLAATGNSNYGWFGGGSPATATVDRIDFSNDSVTASVRGPLSLARYSLAATGNSNYGWFGGGNAAPGPAVTNRVDRIDFANDSISASPRGALSQAREGLSATSNTNK